MTARTVFLIHGDEWYGVGNAAGLTVTNNGCEHDINVNDECEWHPNICICLRGGVSGL